MMRSASTKCVRARSTSGAQAWLRFGLRNAVNGSLVAMPAWSSASRGR